MSRRRAPILLYHGVAECADDAIRDAYYFLPAASISAQFRWLRVNGFSAVPLDELLSFSAGWERRCAITIDDGLLSAYTHIFPALRDAGLRAAVFPIVGMVGHRGWVSWRQLNEMVAEGMEVGSHTMSHADLTRLSRSEALRELAGSKKRLEDALGVAVRYLSLPGGYHRPSLRDLAREAGYEGICCSTVGYNRPPPDRYALRRFCVRPGDDEALLRRIMRGRCLSLAPRFMAARGRDLGRRMIGERAYLALRRILIPRGVHAELPRFPRG